MLSLALLVPLLMLCGCADVSRLNIDFASKEARNAQLQKELDKSVGDFVVAPYLQLGYGTDTRCSDSLDLLWFTRRAQAGEYKILVKTSKDADYRVCEPIRRREIKMPGTAEAFYKFAGTMTGLVPGESFDYRLVTMPGNKIVFAASGIAAKRRIKKLASLSLAIVAPTLPDSARSPCNATGQNRTLLLSLVTLSIAGA